MTARELLDEILSQGPRSDALPLECRLIFRQLADNLHQVRLRNGTLLRDLSDVRELFKELVEELAPAPRNGSVASRFNLDFCPDCGHVHVEDSECSFPIGGGRVCRCERQVPA